MAFSKIKKLDHYSHSDYLAYDESCTVIEYKAVCLFSG